ncbi:MAG: HEAT repeat domain-containing protein [Anaerolineae bacterium]
MAGRPDTRTQDELLAALSTGSIQEQKEILERLAAIGEAEALDAVIELLRDAPEETEDEALQALRVLATKYVPTDRYALAEVVLPILESTDWPQRLAAARLVNTHPNELAVDPLRDLIEEARERVYTERNNRFSPRRILAERSLWEGVLALANCGKLNVLPEILALLDDPYMRPIAVRALGVIGSETERPHLEDLAEDEDFRVRDSAQWALGLMDERAAQFMLTPDQLPPPPPDRLNGLYWMHRQLRASSNELVQLLVVRIAIEHLLLDVFLVEGRNPLDCDIILREYEGHTPPDPEKNETEVMRVWHYQWNGPTLTPGEIPDPPPAPRRVQSTRPGVMHHSEDETRRITITYPRDLLSSAGEGLVTFDCQFDTHFGRGWIYQLTLGERDWSFARVRQTWSS